jgi:hypothetical protein
MRTLVPAELESISGGTDLFQEWDKKRQPKPKTPKDEIVVTVQCDSDRRGDAPLCPRAPWYARLGCELLWTEAALETAEELAPDAHGESIPPDHSTPPNTFWMEEHDGTRVRVSDGSTRTPGALGTNVP